MCARKKLSDACAAIPFEEIRKHFHKPLHEASQHFGHCDTFFKKICRCHGIQKWPYRDLMRKHGEVRSLLRKLEAHWKVSFPRLAMSCDVRELDVLITRLRQEVCQLSMNVQC